MANEIQVTVGVNTRPAEKAIKDFDRKTSAATVNIKNNFSKLDGAIASFAGNLAANAVTGAINALASGFSAAIDEIVSSTIELEQTRTQFQVLTGSIQEADKVIRDLQNFTATTPFQFQGVADAAAQLISFGFEAETITDKLRVLGDIAAGSNSDLQEVALIFGQVSAAGKLTGERLLQLQERAIPIGPALAKTLGVAESSVRSLVSQGKVDFATFEEAFRSLTEEGGLFFEATIKQSKTLGGVISTLKDNFAIVAQDIGQQFLPTLKAVAVELIRFVQANRELIKSFATDAFNGFISAIRFGIEVIGTFSQGIALIDSAIDGLVASSFEASAAVLDFAASTVEAVNSVKEFLGLEPSKEVEKTSAALREQAEVFRLSADAGRESSQETLDNEVEKQIKIQETADIFKTAKAEEAAAVEETNARKVASETQTTDAITAERQRLIEQTKRLQEEEAVRLEELRLLQQERPQLEADEDFAFLQEKLGTEEALRQTAAIQAQKNEEKAAQTRLKARKKAIDAEIKTESRKNDFIKLSFQEQVKASQTTADLLVQFAGNATKQQGGIYKSAVIAQTILNGISAIQFALAGPFPLNLIQSALIAGITAQNISKAKASPAFQDGGIVPGNSFTGDNVSAQVNSGEMILNRQQQGDLFNAINTGQIGGGTSITIQGNVIADDESQVNDLMQKIKDQIEFRNATLV